MVLPWFHEYQMPRMVNEGVEGKRKTGERGKEILRKFEACKRRLSRHDGARGGIYAQANYQDIFETELPIWFGCPQVELLLAELLLHVCAALPVDTSRM